MTKTQLLLQGAVYGTIAQVLTYLQLQGNIKYNWYQRYPIPMLLLAIPVSYCFIKSVEKFVEAYQGETWPSRMLGYGLGVIVFAVMSWLVFKEPITTKTAVCLLLSVAIIAVQVWWK